MCCAQLVNTMANNLVSLHAKRAIQAEWETLLHGVYCTWNPVEPAKQLTQIINQYSLLKCTRQRHRVFIRDMYDNTICVVKFLGDGLVYELTNTAHPLFFDAVAFVLFVSNDCDEHSSEITDTKEE